MALHEVQLKGYSVRPGNLSLGTFDSYGIEQLHVTLDDTWSGLAVTATFNLPEGEPVEIRVPENGLIDVPAEATANEGTGTIVYCGVANGAQRISKTQGYSVITHGNVGTTVAFNPSESLATQVLQAALSAEQSSAEAKSVANGLRSDAANGKFNGKDGAKGDKGDTGTTPQLKIGEDNLWHVSYDNGATWVSLGVKATGDTGAAGKDGVNGLTPSIGGNGNWWIGDTDTGVLAKGKKGDTGAKGADGVSPTAAVTQTDDGAKFTVTDASGITTAVVKNGVDGKNGAPGANGVSPTVQVETIDGGHRVTLTDASGAHAVDVLDGKPGKDAVVDATLTQDGQAADAKVTGEKIGQLKEDKLNKPALPVVGELLRVKSVSDTGEVELETEDISELQKRQNVLVGSETGNPVSCDDAFAAPLCGLNVYGKSTQDGTPTPDSPVPIVSAGDGGTIAVTLSDGNGELQTLTLQTPNGLSGIPVTSGGNYTDPQGQQWVCDEVNLERGIYIKRVSTTVLTVGMVQSLSQNVNDYCITINPPIDYKYTNNIRIVLMSNRFIYDKKDKNKGVIFGYGFQIRLYVDQNEIETLAEAEEFIEKNQIEIMYEVNEPTETPLSPAELAAYKALTTYAPTTIVQASAGASIRLGYQRDVNLVVKNLEDAIASMTTT